MRHGIEAASIYYHFSSKEELVDVVMEHGAIVETGTHAELIARGGLYARLWAHQTGGFVGVA